MKSVKNLLVPFIIMIALVIGVIIYFVVENIKASKPSEPLDVGTDVVYFNSTDISSLSVLNNVTGRIVKINCSIAGDNDIIYEYLGDDAEPDSHYSQYKLADYVTLLTSYYSSSRNPVSGAPAEYGLDNPGYTVTINAVNGSVTTVYLGNKSPDENYCYIRVDGSTDIYMVSSDKLLQAEKTGMNFLDSRILSINDNELKAVHFDRKTDGLSLDASVNLTATGLADYEIIKPYTHPASSYFTNMIRRILNLEITDYIDIYDSDLAKYGLDTPAFHFIITLNSGEKKELYFSKLINDCYYGYIVGNDKYFMLSNYQLENIEMNELDLINPYICYCYAKDYSSITGTYGDKSFKLSLDVPEGKSIMDDSSIVTLDGRNAKISDSYGRSYCSILFESISCIEIGGIDTAAVVNTNGGPDLTLSFNNKSYVTTLYEFYTRDNDSYYVFKDGEYMNFYVYSREIFLDGGQDTYNYGYWKAYELLNTAISGSISGIYDMPSE